MSEQYMTSDFWAGGLLLAETDARLIDVQVNRGGGWSRSTILYGAYGSGRLVALDR